MKNKLVSLPIYQQAIPVTDGMDFDIVEISESMHTDSWHVHVVIKNRIAETSIEDCVKVHKALRARFSMLRKDRALTMEVSTPGLQRTMKDVHEFTLFIDSPVKIYDNGVDDWIRGRIVSVDETTLTLEVGGNTIGGEGSRLMEMSFSSITKAKLDSIWEGDD